MVDDARSLIILLCVFFPSLPSSLPSPFLLPSLPFPPPFPPLSSSLPFPFLLPSLPSSLPSLLPSLHTHSPSGT